MALTEVVYKIRSEEHPFCQLTEDDEELKVIINTGSWDPDTGQQKGILNIVGNEPETDEFLDYFPKLFDEYEVLDQDAEETSVRFEASLGTLQDTFNPLAFTLEYFGEVAIVEPALVQEGYFHCRILAPGDVDLASMLEDYESGVEEGFWDDFKLVRMDDYDAEMQAEGAFVENLTQKQLEVIKTGLALGFYNTPRDITLDDLSNIFGISKAAVHNRLQAAERKVISKFFS
jgi:predicted DNA binding protein